MSITDDKTVGVEPWDCEWAAERAAEALRYLGHSFPECLENLRVLDEHETAAHEAAMRGDRGAYLEALRDYCRAGRDEALRIPRTAWGSYCEERNLYLLRSSRAILKKMNPQLKGGIMARCKH
jgi:hypothetical protein